VEFVAAGESVAAGEPGEIVVSGLYNHAQPLLRYKIGDIGVPSDTICACGRQWPLIESIEGRELDFVVLPSGKKLAPGFIFGGVHSELEEHVLCLSQFQVIQPRSDLLILNVVKGKAFDPEVVARINANLEGTLAELGEAVAVEIRYAESLEEGRTGKVQMVVSLVDG
jgi:phenylacetate-CoA ligase